MKASNRHSDPPTGGEESHTNAFEKDPSTAVGMTLWTKKLVLLSIVLFLILIAFTKRNPIQNNINKILRPTITPTVQPLPQTAYTPYMIQTLRNRSYQKSTIEIGEKAYEANSFTSYLATYISDGLKINTLVSFPKNKSTSYLVLVMCHGYIYPASYSTISSYKKTFDYYATQGFIVIKPDYRANGNSEGDRKNLYNRLSYPIDVLNLIASIPTLSHVDTNQLFLWGHSLGGDVALRVMEVNPNIKAASLWAPVSADYPESMLYYVRRKQPEELQKYKDTLKKITTQDELDALSPSKNLTFIKTRLIIHQGTADTDVPPTWNIDLDKRLTKDNIDHKFYLYSGEDHNFNGGSRGIILQRDIEFFNSELK